VRRYRSFVSDNARWEGFPFRGDDIVISTPPKCGTTWTQTLCVMLVLGTTELPAPLSEISPWLDMQTNELSSIVTRLESQTHRRVIKTHTPFDGLPVAAGVTYICVGRDPRDVSLSWDHHMANMDMENFINARIGAVGMDDVEELGPMPEPPPEDPVERFWQWADYDGDSGAMLGITLPNILRHLQTFWDVRDRPGIALFHYSDLSADLAGEVRCLAGALGIDASDELVERIATAATFGAMRADPETFVPDVANRIWQSNTEFFHRGTSGQWRTLLDEEDLARYEKRVASLVAPDLARWAHDGWSGLPRQTY
jgi:hypothetical protein